VEGGLVSAVTIFPDKTALHFLSIAQPDIYVKGGDYTMDTINQDERRAVEGAGGTIVLLTFVEGRSTTATLKRLESLQRSDESDHGQLSAP
jgi:bifunctional ADP-heptose synthase (sugar kinase/adenylyltransferase)